MSYSTFFFNRQGLIENFNNLGTKNVCAMVKANAYGVGLEPVCKSLFGKAKFFGVATLNEGLKIRKFDKITPILIVGIVENFWLAFNNNLSITIDNFEQLETISEKLKNTKINKQLKIHIKINSGMNRFGINNKKIIKKLIKIIKNNKKIIFEGIFTHFSTINEDEVFFEKQLKMFTNILKVIPPIFNPIKHMGGGDILKKINLKDYPDFMFRVGFNLYGKNVVKITSQVIKLHSIKSGDRVGYSNGYLADKTRQVAVVPLGYADGINRKLSNQGFVKINGRKCAIIGNVCMDAFFVDVSNLKCKIGDEVLVFYNVFDWAKICQTIPYEILTSLNYFRMNYKIIY